ncbi:class I SAM-dependent methyltransferase [Candidatus Daviesbacteria bacterium]|nr:class I SAM-dependent methyltransferase [Candidatus Daviesbacteria bacterium]
MTYEELKKVYDQVGQRSGWDFSKLKDEREPVPWNYLDVVKAYLQDTFSVLDVGTGGGEKFIKLSEFFTKGVGVDPDPDMIKTANVNKKKAQNSKVTFEQFGAENLEKLNQVFDLIINRHAPVVADQIVKVLRQGGYFITQQVTSKNMQNFRDIFNISQFVSKWHNNLDTMVPEFKKLKCRIVATGEYDVNYWVKDVKSLIFWLKAIDMPKGFNMENHWQQINEIVEKFTTPQGIVSNEHRQLLITQKL